MSARRILGSAVLLFAVTSLYLSSGPFGLAAPSAASSGAVRPSLAPVATADHLPAASPRAPHPAAVTLTVDGATPRAISLTWTAAANFGFSNYTLQMSTVGAAGPWTTLQVITSASDTSYTSDSLTPGATYYWQVVSNNLFASSDSNVVSEAQPTLAYLSVTTPTGSSAQFGWTNNASYGGSLAFLNYTLLESENGDPATVAGVVTSQSTLELQLDGLAAGASYAFYLNTTDCVLGCGTASPTPSITESNVVDVGTPRPLVASISADRSVVDVGQADFVACTPSGGVAPYSFTWTFGNASPVAGQSSESVAFNRSGEPTVACLVSDSASSSSSAATTLTVNPAPQVEVSVNRSAADPGQAIGYLCTGTNGTAPLAYGWEFGDGGSASGASAAHAYGANGTFAASCTVTDFTGTQVTSTVPLTISPAAMGAIGADASTAAPGTLVRFTSSFTGGPGSFGTASWRFGDGATATGTTASHSYASAGTFNVSVRAVDGNGAVATANYLVTITPLTILLGKLPATLLLGTAYTFAATVGGGGGGPYTVTWGFSNGGNVTGTSTTHAFRTAGTYKLSVAATDRLGARSYLNLSLVAGGPVGTGPTSGGLAIPAYWPVLPALLAGVVVALLALGYYRRREERPTSGAAQYVLPTDPGRTLKGTLVCRNCGTPNNAARESCSMCGAEITPTLFG